MINDVVNEQIDMVSIIMPAYNCENYISQTIDSVLAQSYKNWELIVIDDCSTDSTAMIVQDYSLSDSRVKYYLLDENSGAAIARNTAIEMAEGRFIAFLDSDDIWNSDKLEKQILFMLKNNHNFTCTSYSKIDNDGNDLSKIVYVKKIRDYDSLLKKSPGNSTVIYDSSVLGKFYIPNIRKRNDYVMWLQVIKKAQVLIGLEEILSSHRVREGSLSKKKTDLVKYHWIVYRQIEKLSLLRSCYLIVYWITKTILNYFRK